MAGLTTASLLLNLSLTQIVRADQFDSQIQNLQQQNSQTRSSLSALESQASSLSDLISKLQGQISSLQTQISTNQAKSTELQAKISQAEAELARQRKTLGADIKQMYFEGKVTTLEMLASSKNLSDFVDKQQYRTAVQNKIKTTLDRITELRRQLASQKEALEALIRDQQRMQSDLAAQTAQQNQILAMNEQQQSSLNGQIQANNAQISALRAQQRAAYARLLGTGGTSPVGSSIVYKNMMVYDCGGGYSYCNSGLDDWVDDPWGLHYARECVHYAADAVTRRGAHIPYNLFAGQGNAYQWSGTVSGVATIDGNPSSGAVVYMPIGPLGHVGMVEEVLGDGWIHVSQMNFPSGRYSEMDLKVTGNLQFFHFH